MTKTKDWGRRLAMSAIVLAGLALATTARAECSRATLAKLTDAYVKASERLTEQFASVQQLSDQVLRDFVVLTEPFLRSVLDFTMGLLKWAHRIERWFGGMPTSDEETDHWLQSR